MAFEFALPDVGEGVAEGELVTWLVAEGDTVEEDQPLAEVETDKALVELPSPVAGTVAALLVEEGDVVPVGTPVIRIDVEGEAPDESTASSSEPAPSDDRVFAPPSLRQRARDAGVDPGTIAGSGPGNRPTAGDIWTAMTGHATEPETPAPQTADARRDDTLATPAARGVAADLGVDIDAVHTDATHEGEDYVTAEAVRAAADQPADRTTESERRESFTGVRRTIAQRLAESRDSAVHVTHHDAVDVTRLVEVRETLRERLDRDLTYLPFILQAVVGALREYPQLNARLDLEAEEVVYRNYYNIGVATATDVGLMVPVVEHVDRKDIASLAEELRSLVGRVRERSVDPESLQGSTFTVTNVGAIGGEYATPILNPPDTGILAVGSIDRRPWVVTGPDGSESVEPRWVMPLSLSFDHRLVDGAEAAQFTNAVMERLERPELLTME